MVGHRRHPGDGVEVIDLDPVPDDAPVRLIDLAGLHHRDRLVQTTSKPVHLPGAVVSEAYPIDVLPTADLDPVDDLGRVVLSDVKLDYDLDRSADGNVGQGPIGGRLRQFRRPQRRLDEDRPRREEVPHVDRAQGRVAVVLDPDGVGRHLFRLGAVVTVAPVPLLDDPVQSLRHVQVGPVVLRSAR